MTSVQVLSALFLILYCFVNFDLGSTQDEFYKKFIQSDYNLKVDREIMVFYNRTLVDVNHTFSKYNRTQFVSNISALFHIDVGNDLEVIVQVYKFLSNEYRVFPLRYECNACKSIKYNMAGIQSCINACGNIMCPIKTNIRYYICNCIIDETKLPPFMPNGNFKVTLEAIYKNQLLATLESYITISRKVLPERRYLG